MQQMRMAQVNQMAQMSMASNMGQPQQCQGLMQCQGQMGCQVLNCVSPYPNAVRHNPPVSAENTIGDSPNVSPACHESLTSTEESHHSMEPSESWEDTVDNIVDSVLKADAQ